MYDIGTIFYQPGWFHSIQHYCALKINTYVITHCILKGHLIRCDGCQTAKSLCNKIFLRVWCTGQLRPL